METIGSWQFDMPSRKITDSQNRQRFFLSDIPVAYGPLIAACPEMKAAISASTTCMMKVLSNCIIDVIRPEDARRKVPELDVIEKRIRQIVEKTVEPGESDWIFNPNNGMIVTAATKKLVGKLVSSSNKANGYLIATAPKMRELLVRLQVIADFMRTHLTDFSSGTVTKHHALYQEIRRLDNPLVASQDVLAMASGLVPFRVAFDTPPCDNGENEAMR